MPSYASHRHQTRWSQKHIFFYCSPMTKLVKMGFWDHWVPGKTPLGLCQEDKIRNVCNFSSTIALNKEGFI